MKAVVRTIFFVLTCFSTQVMADAPVVDDSENFALLEEQIQVADEELPVAHDSYTIRADDSEATFVRDVAQNTTTSNTDLINKIQSLQREIQDLRGQVEVQAHELNDLKQQQLSFYQDIDTRLNQHTTVASAEKPQTAATQENTETPFAATKPTLTQAATDIQSPPTSARLNPADEQISYLAAYDLIKQKKFPQASLAMQQFLSKYPRGGYSANAHYWLGELYLVNKDYANAITQFDSVIQNFKSSSKYAPSRLKMGYALADTGRTSEAKQQLLAVINHYPDTSTARLAHAKLEALGG